MGIGFGPPEVAIGFVALCTSRKVWRSGFLDPCGRDNLVIVEALLKKELREFCEAAQRCKGLPGYQSGHMVFYQ